MRARQTVLATTDVQQAIPEVHLVPAERNQFGDAQAMAIGELDHGGIPVSMASKAFRRANEGVHLGGGDRVSRKEAFLGESILAEWGRERKTKTKSYGSQGAPQVLTVGFRTAAAANPCCNNGSALA